MAVVGIVGIMIDRNSAQSAWQRDIYTHWEWDYKCPEFTLHMQVQRKKPKKTKKPQTPWAKALMKQR